MYPDLFGIKDFSYIFMIIIGVIAAVTLFIIFMKKKSSANYLDLLVVAIFSILIGVVFAILFENVYEAIKAASLGTSPRWTWGMTFYGGLVGGVIVFLLLYRFYYLKHNKPILKDVLLIAPSFIALGHGIGRLGCFLAGCCYGIEMENGVYFQVHDAYLLPTQLIEMSFLLVLSLILGIFAFKNITKYTMPIYMFSYGVFRFIIEFFRGDERGQIGALSPSQYWCIIMVIGSIALFIFYNRYYFKKEVSNAI